MAQGSLGVETRAFSEKKENKHILYHEIELGVVADFLFQHRQSRVDLREFKANLVLG